MRSSSARSRVDTQARYPPPASTASGTTIEPISRRRSSRVAAGAGVRIDDATRFRTGAASYPQAGRQSGGGPKRGGGKTRRGGGRQKATRGGRMSPEESVSRHPPAA